MPGRLTLPRPARLRTTREFDRVFRKRQKIDNPLFVIHYAPSGVVRLGISVSRRVAPQAVARNRIRRRVRESFRAQRELLPSHDFVVQARPAAARASTGELREALDLLWQRIIES